ncbi:YitT family protein [Paenibacillus dokdonensis]|uniref:YitT family protein n=1 Tax=Paenibacillus dokdonensis TaxID=2567944 RepID=A0ABU6GWN7_9BACL|nr:YitT family protein [Paenibacillus dokdonensis]MEC0243507.1 YitT family protein [Paenibacillus dokdonensis]
MRKKDHFISKLAPIVIMLFGTFLLAFAYYHINFQNHLSEGGFVGLSLLGKYVLGLNPSLSMLILDIPVILIAMFLKGRKFVMNTLLATFSFSIFYELLERYSVLVIDLHNNLLLAALLSGLVTGFATGLVLRFGGATGGDDILSLLISRWSGLKVGTVFILMDAAVLLLSLFYLPLKETLFTILAVGIAGQTITFTFTFRMGKADVTAIPELAQSQKAASKPVHAVRSAH